MAHVVADSSSSSVADQLSVRLGQEYRVKLGRSFTFPEQNSFHTIKYDFKPQSVDSTKPGHLKVTDDEVNVSLPVVGQGDSVEDFTHFRGNKKPCMKECILIINTRTGEAILEKISNNVNLKAVRDGRKPQPAVNRDRSVSPSPFMMQSKGHQSTKSQLSTGGHRHLTPSPIPTSTLPTSNSSTPSGAKVGGASTAPGNGTKKGQKRQTAKTKTPKTASSVSSIPATVKQESTGVGKGGNGRKPKAKKKSESSSSKPIIPVASKIKAENAQSSLTASSIAMSLMPSSQSMPVLGMGGMELGREISPIHSANPTPEPILPPSRKKPKLTTENSSSSSSDSSDSDSEGEEPFHQVSNAPPIQTQAPPHFSSTPVTRVNMPVFSSSGPAGGAHVAQKGRIAQKSQSQLVQQQQSQQSHHHGAVMSQPQLVPPQQRLSSASSSDSDSDSSSGSSSSDSSSDSSDEENDKEVAALSSGQVTQAQRSYTRSFSELKTDLHLSSDSGSSSD